MKDILNQLLFDPDIFGEDMDRSRVLIDFDLPYESVLMGDKLPCYVQNGDFYRISFEGLSKEAANMQAKAA